MNEISVFKRIVTLILCKFFHRVEYIGEENLDYSNSYIFAANHVNWLDGIFLWAKTPNIHIMAKEELFKIKWFGNILKSQGVFPIAREKKDYKSLYYAVNVVRSKEPKTLLIFPEGTRQAAKKKAKGKNGAVYISAATHTPIIPIYISNDRMPFSKVQVIYGKPFVVDIDREKIKDKEILTVYTEKLMQQIYEMKGNI